MLQSNALRLQILNVLQTQIMPWINSGAPFALLDIPPKVIGANKITEIPGKKLPLQRGAGREVRTQFWREENLNAMTVPYMGCVIEGEADIVIGTTTAICSRHKIPGTKWVFQAPQKTVFLVPPQVPLSSGGAVHWERAAPENAYSRILWMQFHSGGMSCHFCTSSYGKHRSHPEYFIPSSEMLPLAQSLINEMNEQVSQYVPLVYLYLRTMLHVMLRNVEVPQNAAGESIKKSVSSGAATGASDEVLQEAIHYIDRHINNALMTAEEIALSLHLSARHLSRLFQRDTGMPIMTFVTQRRMELASRLLKETSYTVRQVAMYSGYSSVPSFIKAFIRHFGVSPAEFRGKKTTPSV